ncbi:MAG: hypothetical protein IJF92_00460 [Bacilli bacterium]|nr:hypothetical protein [Bacilli bacterium]MBQ3307540.1 hypothetical protein [Bacilli bacterium]
MARDWIDEDGYTLITPDDLGSVLSVLQFIIDYAQDRDNEELKLLAGDLYKQFFNVFEITDADKLKLPYNRKSYSTILEYLKLQAEQLSEGRWNDFSDSDIGVVILKLMSYLADMQNYNVDKSIAELYLSTCRERASALLLCRLIGYKPRHYMSAKTNIWLGAIQDEDDEGNLVEREIPNGTVFPRGSTFSTGTDYIYTTLEDAIFTDNLCNVDAYEGTLKEFTFELGDITDLGRVVLPDYAIAFNTVQLFIDNQEYKAVEDVTINTGGLEFSVHCSEDRYIYLQLPAFWADVVTAATSMKITYLISNGKAGRVGQNKIQTLETACTEKSNIRIISNSQSIEGYDPETLEEIKHSAPIHARTMNTLVTLDDFESIGGLTDGIADVRALDYNDPSSGLIQPTPGPGGYVNDAYKVNIYVLPDCVDYDEENPENNKYRNTIIKFREDWNWNDMQYVAENVEQFAQASITGNQIILAGYGITYTDVDDIVLGVDTLKTVTSFLPKYVDTIPGSSEEFTYTVNISGDDVIVTMCNNWRDFMPTPLSKISIFFKQTQVLTEAGQQLRETIDSRRLHSLWITYYDVEIIEPKIYIEIYMDSRDIRFESIATQVKEFILKRYARDNYLKLGDPIFASVIGSDILNEFDFIRYVEVGLPTFTDDLIEVLPRQFLDIIPPNVETKAIDYQYKQI